MRALLLAPVAALVLTGCSTADPQAELRGDVESVTLAANDGDAGGVRDAVEELLSTIRRQVVANELSREKGEALRAIALRIAENAGLLDPEPSPSPTEEPSPTEAASPTEEPSPTEESSPTPEPSPTEELPVEEPSPTEEPSPILEISPASTGSSPSPAAAQASSQPSPGPTSSPAA